MAFESAAVRAISVPIVYGNISFWLGTKRGSLPHMHAAEPTHSWCVYVRHPEDKDLSYAIAKVTFKLHETFPNSLREITSPPYCVKESGWGEFEVGIRITLRDPAADPIVLTHKLRLYGSTATTEEPSIMDETYDEIVFNTMPSDPAIAAALARGPIADAPPYPWSRWMGTFAAAPDLVKIEAARNWINDRKLELQDRLLRVQQELEREREEVRTLSGGFTAGTVL